jgi:hypothetical protein
MWHGVEECDLYGSESLARSNNKKVGSNHQKVRGVMGTIHYASCFNRTSAT